MGAQRLRLFVLVGGVIILAGLLAVRLGAVPSSQAMTAEDCRIRGGSYLDLPPAQRDYCLQIKPTLIAQQERNELATSAAASPVPTSTPGVEPTYTMSDGTKSLSQQAVEPLDKSAFVGMHEMRAATSIWHNGSVEDKENNTWRALYVYVLPGDNNTSTIVSTIFADKQSALGREYERSWTSPRSLGQLTITGVSGGLKGIVSFKDAEGHTGSLNMATNAWTFDQ